MTLLPLVLLLLAAGPAAAAPPAPGPADPLSALPLGFEPNVGQADPAVDFVARGRGYSVRLGPTAAVLALRGPAPAVVRMALPGADPAARGQGQHPLPGRAHYLLGRDPRRWRTDVPTYARVRYAGVYPGIDLVYYGAGRHRLEYDFLVAPGADPAAIRVAFTGVGRLALDAGGALVVPVAGGHLRLEPPVLYQEIAGVRRPVRGGYVLAGPDGWPSRWGPTTAAGRW